MTRHLVNTKVEKLLCNMKLKIETIEQLENWMIENNYKKHSYIIGTYFFTTEGSGIDNNGGLYS